MAIASDYKKLHAKSTKCQKIKLSKMEQKLFGQKPMEIIGKTQHNGIVWYIVQLEKKNAILLNHDFVIKKYPQLLLKSYGL
ncbi:hypothetical protein niasHS_017032 [Heterodera schachtii]|uniref:Uncharacterized protein n=2 Tax=Heterodera TaxID=34509 RepID=A0ABD2HZD2_HETSC